MQRRRRASLPAAPPREFTADAARVLHAPIALVRMRIEAVEDEALRVDPKRDIDQLGRTVDQLLETLELVGALPALDEAVDLRALAVSTVLAIAPLVFARQRRDDRPRTQRPCRKRRGPHACGD